MNELITLVTTYVVPGALRIIGAIAMWIAGGYVIAFVLATMGRFMEKDRVDPSLVRYVRSTVSVLLRVFLIIAILGTLGVETTSFAALIAAAGIGIGAAWSGLLAHFAAGIFLLLLRPFKVGDAISAAGVTGKVVEIGLFATSIDTPEGVRVVAGNNKIFADNIANYSVNPYRRVELSAEISDAVDPQDAIARLQSAVAKIPNVLAEPAPVVEILAFSGTGIRLAVRPYCDNRHYWNVYFATNKTIHETFTEAKYPAAEQRYAVRAVGS
jgi:small conductance mechanosensitive channel